jgi:putative addiction module killer protein
MVEVRKTEQFESWVRDLRDLRAKAKVLARVSNMELGNFGDCKPVGSGVSESRINYGPGYRVYFIQRGEKVVVLLCGGDKSTQQRDIDAAISIAQDLF